MSKGNGSILTRDLLLAAKPRKVETVDVEGIGHVCIRSLSARDALALEVQMRGDRDSAEGLASIVGAQLASFICDAEGNQILSIEDAAQLVVHWSANQVRAVIREGVRLNALGSDSVEEAGGN